jgi:ankyrin repeat protein
MRDNNEIFFELLNNFKIQINRGLIDKIIVANSTKIIKQLLKNNNMNEYLLYYTILMTNSIDYFKSAKIDMDIDVALNFLKEIVSNGAYDSFMFLFKNDNTIISTIFEHKKNILHFVKPNNKYREIIDVMMETNPELIYMHDEYNEMPLFYHAKHNSEILLYLLKFDIDFTHLDNDGNTCLHHLCKKNDANLLRKILEKYTEIIDLPNLNDEYPVIISSKCKQEEMIYAFQEYNVDMMAKDAYGNTAYHYICSNSLCLGIEIPLVQNYFGLTPKDYCKISHKYYNFINNE